VQNLIDLRPEPTRLCRPQPALLIAVYAGGQATTGRSAR